MLGILMIIAAVVIMVKAADMEGRSSVLWGALTLILCLACGALIPLPLINIAIGLGMSYFAMFIMKLVQER